MSSSKEFRMPNSLSVAIYAVSGAVGPVLGPHSPQATFPSLARILQPGMTCAAKHWPRHVPDEEVNLKLGYLSLCLGSMLLPKPSPKAVHVGEKPPKRGCVTFGVSPPSQHVNKHGEFRPGCLFLAHGTKSCERRIRQSNQPYHSSPTQLFRQEHVHQLERTEHSM